MKTEKEVREAIERLKLKNDQLMEAGVNKGQPGKYATLETGEAMFVRRMIRTLNWVLSE